MHNMTRFFQPSISNKSSFSFSLSFSGPRRIEEEDKACTTVTWLDSPHPQSRILDGSPHVYSMPYRHDSYHVSYRTSMHTVTRDTIRQALHLWYFLMIIRVYDVDAWLLLRVSNSLQYRHDRDSYSQYPSSRNTSIKKQLVSGTLSILKVPK